MFGFSTHLKGHLLVSKCVASIYPPQGTVIRVMISKRKKREARVESNRIHTEATRATFYLV